MGELAKISGISDFSDLLELNEVGRSSNKSVRFLENYWMDWSQEQIMYHKGDTTSDAVRFYGIPSMIGNSRFSHLKREC
ncbi:hypothetical protein HNV12_00075 [Methanococcoides sp. SA1]|nr:hypothetical protein [Methanococcoides sp. SA1]